MDSRIHPIRRYFNNLKPALTNRNNPRYKNYGGRGIKMDPRWLAPAGFDVMCEALGYDPSDPNEATIYKSIQRVDQSGDFTEDNCFLSKHTYTGIKAHMMQEHVDRELDAYEDDDEREPTPTQSTVTANALAGL